ncbi:MAG: division/cell wall cluster transcriptional repressor MraZ [Clostridiales bacterium]|nr:division/cell wall cluster transcriptional repressor MraZ [Clostridiales bacterium]
MFVGTYYNSIDSKARLIIPAKFRDELGGRCIIAKSLDRCLTIYTNKEWEKLVEKLDELPTGNPNARKLKRYFNSSANLCDVDKQGRLTIPQELREYAGIEKDLITIGSNKTIEVWSKEQWKDELDPETGELMNASDVAESLEQYGF